MLKNVKKGIGLAIGMSIGYGAVKCTKVAVLAAIATWAANDEAYMEELKERKPDLYEKAKKFVMKKEESVEEEEVQ